MSRALRRDEGFTLIEFMIATMIASILMVAVYGAFHSGSATVRAVDEVSSADLAVQAAVGHLVRDTGGAARNPISGPKLLDTGTGSTLILHVPVLTPGAEGTKRVVYEYVAASGTLTRTSSAAGVTRVDIVARELRKNSTARLFACLPVAAACDSTSTSVEVTLPLTMNGVEVTRTFSLPVRVVSQP